MLVVLLVVAYASTPQVTFAPWAWVLAGVLFALDMSIYVVRKHLGRQ